MLFCCRDCCTKVRGIVVCRCVSNHLYSFFHSTFWRNTSPLLDLNCSIQPHCLLCCYCCCIHAVILSMTHFKCTLFSMAFLCIYILQPTIAFCHKRVCSCNGVDSAVFFLYHIVCFMCTHNVSNTI